MIHIPLFIAIYYCVISLSPWQNFACSWHPCTHKFSSARKALASRVFSTHGHLKNCCAIAKSARWNLRWIQFRCLATLSIGATFGMLKGCARFQPSDLPLSVIHRRAEVAAFGRLLHGVRFRIFNSRSSRIILHENCVHVANPRDPRFDLRRSKNEQIFLHFNERRDWSWSVSARDSGSVRRRDLSIVTVEKMQQVSL